MLAPTHPRLMAQESDIDPASYQADFFTFVRIVYDSAGGQGEAYYPGTRVGYLDGLPTTPSVLAI